jgi:hypothetical protein
VSVCRRSRSLLLSLAIAARVRIVVAEGAGRSVDGRKPDVDEALVELGRLRGHLHN